MNITNLFDTDDFVSGSRSNNPNYKGSFKEVSEAFKAKNLSFHVRIMEAKTFSYPYHWHTGEEELFIVLEGEATVRCNGEFKKVKAGDLIYYGTGPESVHQMYNHSDLPFKFFALSNVDETEKCYYPDSKKESSPQGPIQNGVVVEYLKDEEDPSIYWPKDKL